jgi:peptidoglycan/LPS O-acetylase OafA/YrhL
MELKYIKNLDVLRGIAILFVVVYHYLNVYSFFQIGWVGVDLFFVLSGFLITRILWRTRFEKRYFINFYAKRILRIFPLYYVYLIGYFFLFPLFFNSVYTNDAFLHYYNNKSWFFSFMANWFFIIKGLPKDYTLVSLWSIGIEEQFYIFFPFFIFLCRKSKKLPLIIALVIIAVVLYRTYLRLYYIPNPSFVIYSYNAIARFDAFLVGGLGYFLIDKINKKMSIYIFASTLSIVVFFVFYFNSISFENPFFGTLGFTILAIHFVSWILLATKTKIWESTFSKVLSFFGKISYALYLTHIVIKVSCVIFFTKYINVYTTTSKILLPLTAFIISILISTASFYYFEKPIMKLRKHFI